MLEKLFRRGFRVPAYFSASEGNLPKIIAVG